MRTSLNNRPLRSFLILCAASVIGLAAFFYWVRTRSAAPPPPHGPIPAADVTAPLRPMPQSGPTVAEGAGRDAGKKAAAVAPRLVQQQPAQTPKSVRPGILFRYTGVDSNYGRVAMVDYADVQHPRFAGDLTCNVVYFAAGHGICLTAGSGVFTTYAAVLFGPDFKERVSMPVQGVPSRCRVSPDGKLAAFTVFVTGHSYSSLDFTTQTLLLETATGKVLGDLETFAVTRDGEPFRGRDFNFWGVTFAPDSRRFYSTLSSNRRHYLVEGDIASRTAVVIHENVECPSVSPDGKRIGYKKRLTTSNRAAWQLHVLDLNTHAETPLSEGRSIDDQIEWLDNDHVLYSVSQNPTGSSASTDVWKASADGKSPPEVLLLRAYSPVVLR